jgi:fructosamine-3-kinase
LGLEYITPRASSDSQRFTQRFAEGLAALHRTPSSTGQYGLERDNVIGALPQVNAWRTTWSVFYRDCRLAPQIALARQLGRLTSDRERLLMGLLEKIDAVLDDCAVPGLIHGDLWSGNFLAAGDEAALIDPAVSYSDREVEIAYIELFGGFPAGFVGAYRSEYPLETGYEERRPLYQLYYLMVHLNLFGEAYSAHVDAVCRCYA